MKRRKQRGHLSVWLAALAVLACACNRLSRPVELPGLPEISTEKFLPAVKEEVGAAYEAVRANPRDASLNGKLGMVLQAHSQFAAAAVCYQRARLLDPKAPAWPYYLGFVDSADGKYKEAAEALREALRLQPGYVPAQHKLAESLMASGALSESGELYEKILKEHPDEATAHYGLGRVRSAQGEQEAAAESYRKACELFPAYGAAHYALARIYRGIGRPEDGQRHLAVYQKHLLDVPPIPDPLLAEVRRLQVDPQQFLRRAIELEAAGQIEQAVAEHEKALAVEPKLVQAHVNLISLYGRLGQFDKAEQHYRAAVALNPNLADCQYNYGVLAFRQGKRREAKEAFLRALEINPYYAEAHHNLGYMLEEEGRQDEAMKHYRLAINNKPAYRLAHFHLGRILANRGRYREAVEQFRNTLNPVDQNTPGYLYALGTAYARSGDRQNALQYIRKARQQAASFGQTQLLAGMDKDIRMLEQAGPRR